MGSWNHALHWSTKILPLSSREGAIILQVRPSSQNHPLVFRLRYNPELLALCPLWSKLALPLDDRSRSCLGDPPSRRLFLHHYLGLRSTCPLSSLQVPLLDPPRLCHRPRRSSLVPDALGYLRNRCFPTMDWLCTGISSNRPCSLALARRTRCAPRCRLRHDPPADNDEIPHLLHTQRRTGARFHLHYLGPSHRPR